MNRAATALRWWVANAVSWIAFGDAEPLPPEAQCSRRWPFDPPDELLPALRSRAERRPWRPEGPWRPERPPAHPPWWRYRAVARGLAREPGMDAAVLADLLSADLARMESHRTALENALTELARAVAGGRIEAWGVRCDAHGEPLEDGIAVRIEPAVFYNGDRTISLDGTIEPLEANGNTPLGEILHPKGARYRDVTFDPAEVRRVWPKPSPASEKIEAARAWMLAEAQRLGGKPKRDPLIKACVAETKCRFEDAEAAHAGLPEEYRRKRGQYDRAIDSC